LLIKYRRDNRYTGNNIISSLKEDLGLSENIFLIMKITNIKKTSFKLIEQNDQMHSSI